MITNVFKTNHKMGLLLFFFVICQLILIKFWQTANPDEKTRESNDEPHNSDDCRTVKSGLSPNFQKDK